MSQVNVDTIRKSDGSAGTDIRIKNTSVYESDGGTSVTQNMVQSLAKSFYRYHQASDNLQNTLNVSSVSDTSAGVFVCTYSNNFQSSDDVTIVSAMHSSTGGRTAQATALTSSNYGGRGFNGTTATDLTYGFASFGDLA